jgi:hypothetical protein
MLGINLCRIFGHRYYMFGEWVSSGRDLIQSYKCLRCGNYMNKKNGIIIGE